MGSIKYRMIRWIYVFLCFSMVLAGGWLSGPASGTAAEPSISTHAVAAALIDVKSGRLLYSQAGDKQMRIASLTKIMTAIVAIENGKLTDRVKVGKHAYRKEGSSIYLHLGEEMSLGNMLYGLMLRSGNDAATAIAEHVGGSLKGFVYMMNKKAEAIGMTHSHFMNPHGLDAEGHYSTANDMAKLTAYALRNPTFREIVKTQYKKVPNPNESWDYIWRNKNKMLRLYDGGDGVKTGYTKKAGRCLVSSATRNGQQLAVVTLNDGNDWLDHANLLDYGFQHFPLKTIVELGAPIQGQPYVAGQDFSYPLAEDEVSAITTHLTLENNKTAAYRLGERGMLHIALNQREIGTVPIYDKNSSRIKMAARTAFDSWEEEPPQILSSDYFAIVKQVFKSLFMVG